MLTQHNANLQIYANTTNLIRMKPFVVGDL